MFPSTIAALGLLSACNHPGQQQTFQPPTGPSSFASRPAFEGTVLVAGRGPLAGANVTVLSRNYSVLGRVQTNADGTFQIPASSQPCEGAVTLRAEKTGYITRQVVASGCVSASNPQVVTVNLKVQELLEASVQAAVSTTLSNDDLDWNADGGDVPLCAPCKLVSIPDPKTEPLEVTIEWSTADRLSIWLIASDRNYDGVTLGTWQAAPGAQNHTITVQPSNGANFYYSVLVGLPAGSSAGGGLTGVADLRVSVKGGG